MQHHRFKSILYFISLVVFVTLAIQVYWNYKNYEAGKQQVKREIQTSLDNAVDAFFLDLADRNTIGITFKSEEIDPALMSKVMDRVDFSNNKNNNFDSLRIEFPDVEFKVGSEIKKQRDKIHNQIVTTVNPIDTIDIQAINTNLQEQLSARNIDIDYAYIYENPPSPNQEFNTALLEEETLYTVSKSAYLPDDSNFKFYYINITSTILKRNFLGILLSAILIAAVVACLFFLLKIIKRQKELAEMKNDLVNNITHEFKTPISTVKVALEGIQNFNIQNDPEKTKNYLQISNNQLDKLQLMVEKLLETSTLDSDELQLEKEPVDLTTLLSELVQKHQNLAPEKELIFQNEKRPIIASVDIFHFENAVNNILDNAVKYGGNKIEVKIAAEAKQVRISISDNGNSLTKTQAQQVFDKFYRVPKGNVHNVKGFGIGLYYTKSIVEKHGGNIKVEISETTNFLINLPNE